MRESLRQIKALLAWQQLKKEEAKPGQPPAFQICDPTEEDLRNEYSFFLSTSVQVHHIIHDNATDIPEAKLNSLKSQLGKIDQELNKLNLNQRFWKS
ncbi:MAG: hypothetical protein ACYS83_05135 [Planctomycetota bacterium]